MKKLNYPLIVSDFDGTLIDDNQKISDEVRSAISEYVESGGIFAVCTGRMLRSILAQVRNLGCKGLVVAYQGTIIADIESGNIIKNGGISARQTAKVCRVLEELGEPINVYSGEEFYTNIPVDNKYLNRYESIVSVKANHVDGKMSEFVLQNDMFCQKVAILVAADRQESLFAVLCEKLGEEFDVTCSASVLIEVSPKQDNKGEALKFLAEFYGVPIEKTIAIGDNLNDLSMIKAAGIGVAVGNATQKLKDAADFISVTNNDGAVAQIIKKYGFA